MAAKPPKKWSKGIELKEGSLTKLGWPNVGAIEGKIASGSVAYKTVISKLNYLANITKDEPTRKKARAAIVRLQRRFKKDKEKK
jgi:hypothetical protein